MFKLNNSDLEKVINFLKDELKTKKAIENVHRMRLVKNLEERFNEFEKDKNSIVKEYAKKDENGEVIQNDNGSVTIIDTASLERDLAILFQETVVIDDSKLKTPIMTVKHLIFDFEGELSGDSGEAHYLLCEELENLEEN